MDKNHQMPPATMPALPVDVIIDILCRLPVETLLRFRCLSKQFRSIIDDPDFIKRHRQYHSLDHQRLILEYIEGTESKLRSLDLDLVDNAFKLELPFEDWLGLGCGVRVIGSCDGLLALSSACVRSIGLWNISTKKHQILPKCDFAGAFGIVYDGFGRDAATDYYKLVKIANFFGIKVTEVSVYSLKANCWRRTDGFPPYSRYYLLGMPALVEGTLNWVVGLEGVEDRTNYLIVSFDLKNEFFFEVSLPDTIGELRSAASHLMVFRGCLGFFNPYQHMPVYDIWVMKEYGLKDSWTKLYSFSYENPPVILNPTIHPGREGAKAAFVCSIHGEMIFILQPFGEVHRYDLQGRKIGIYNINGGSQKDIESVSIYVESLVSPNINN